MSSSSLPRERRTQERLALRCPIELRGAALGSLRGQLLNLSVSGAMVALPCEAPLGSELTLILHLADGRPALELQAIGLRQERAPSGAPPVTVGLSFLMPAREAVERIRLLIYG